VRRNTRRSDRSSRGQLVQLPWRQVINRYHPIEVLEPDQVEQIHQASSRILEKIGIDFLLPEALDILRKAGADTKLGDQRVRFDRGLIESSIATAPSQFTLHARNPDHNLIIGGNYINFGSVGSAPHASDLDRGRRSGNYKDFCNLETWEEAGSQNATQRANELYKRILAEFEPPPLDPSIRDELDDFVARRKHEGGVATA